MFLACPAGSRTSVVALHKELQVVAAASVRGADVELLGRCPLWTLRSHKDPPRWQHRDSGQASCGLRSVDKCLGQLLGQFAFWK